MSLLQETVALFQNVRASIVAAMIKLYEVKETGVWEDKYESWGEFLEDGLGISQGFGSKLLSVHKHYLLEGKLSPSKLEKIDYEKLYMARSLPGPVEEQIEKAKTLTRSELKQERNDEQPHEPEWTTFCKVCRLSKENHL